MVNYLYDLETIEKNHKAMPKTGPSSRPAP